MDTPKTVTHIGLCAGYGGIELGLQRAIPNLRTVALCEIEAFAVANLVAKMEAGFMDPVPIWPNLKTFPWESFRGRVDILTGGYPCQPFSAAGQRKGKDDPRHLWPWIADGVRLLRPRFCFFENVEGHISLGLSDVIEDLAGMGYRTTWGIFSAAEVGAPHQRKRVFILAESSCIGGASRISGSLAWNEGEPGESDNCGNQGQPWPSRPGEQQYGWEPPRVVGNAEGWQDNGREPGDMGLAPSQGGCSDHAVDGAGKAVMADASIIGSDRRPDGTCRWIREPREASGDAAGCGGEGNGMRQTQPPLGGDADGTANRMDDAQLYVSCDNRTDELRLLGNGVVPATAEKAFKTLIEELSR